MDTYQLALARLTAVAAYNAKLSCRLNDFSRYLNDTKFRNSEIRLALEADWAKPRINNILNRTPQILEHLIDFKDKSISMKIISEDFNNFSSVQILLDFKKSYSLNNDELAELLGTSLNAIKNYLRYTKPVPAGVIESLRMPRIEHLKSIYLIKTEGLSNIYYRIEELRKNPPKAISAENVSETITKYIVRMNALESQIESINSDINHVLREK